MLIKPILYNLFKILKNGLCMKCTKTISEKKNHINLVQTIRLDINEKACVILLDKKMKYHKGVSCSHSNTKA